MNQTKLLKRKKQEYSRRYLDKMRNQEYEVKLQMWSNILFEYNRLSFDIPVNSNSGFKFHLSPNRGFAEIHYNGQITLESIHLKHTIQISLYIMGYK